MIGEGPSAHSVRIDLPRFRLMGATTRQGLLTTPLRDRFGIPVWLQFYDVAELKQAVARAACLLGLPLTADGALTRTEVDAVGLDAMDRRYLPMIADIYRGGPMGVETLAAGLGEPRDTIEEVIERNPIQLGLVARTARGRCLNGRAWTHRLSAAERCQDGLFDG